MTKDRLSEEAGDRMLHIAEKPADNVFISISKDKIFKLIKELKEIRATIVEDSKEDTVKRYRLKLQAETMENILKNDGIDAWLNSIKATRQQEKLYSIIAEEND